MMRATLAYRMFLTEAFDESAEERAERGEAYHTKEIPEGAQIAFSRITDAIFERQAVLRVPKNSSYELPFTPFEPLLGGSSSVNGEDEMPPESSSSTEEKTKETGGENSAGNIAELDDTEKDDAAIALDEKNKNKNEEECGSSDESLIMGLVDPRDVMHKGLATFYEDAIAAARITGHSMSYKLDAILDARISDTHFIQVFNTLANFIQSASICMRGDTLIAIVLPIVIRFRFLITAYQMPHLCSACHIHCFVI